MKNKLATALAIMYFIFPMSFALLVLLFMPLGFLMDVDAIRSSGFSGPRTSAVFIGLCGVIIGISLLIPAFRRMYSALPWLYTFVKIFFVNLVLLNIGLAILNFGYEVNSSFRQTSFYLLMIGFVVVGRVGMSVYFNKKSMASNEMR